MLERATLYAMANRVWGAFGGLVTVGLVGTLFSAELQGYYFTFTSLLAFQAFLELGLGNVLQQCASHEWAFVDSDNEGERDRARARLAAILRLAGWWYGAIGLVLVLGLGVGGSAYFDAFATTKGWRTVWWAACLSTGVSVLLVPILSVLEGMNRVTKVYGARLAQGVASRLGSWLAMISGLGLWAVPVARGVTAVVGVLLLSGEIRALGRFRGRARQGFSWRDDIWPLQWKFAVSWLGGYLVFSLFTPVLFAFHGPEAAGRMGMTVSVATAIASIAFAIIATRVPRLAILAARSEFDSMDALFRRATFRSMAVMILGAASFWLALLALRVEEIRLAERFLPPLETALLLLAVTAQQFRFALGSYLRAHKQEPYVGLAAVEGLAALALTSFLGWAYGALGVASGFLFLTTASLLPAVTIFERCRTRWHRSLVTQTNPC